MDDCIDGQDDYVDDYVDGQDNYVDDYVDGLGGAVPDIPVSVHRYRMRHDETYWQGYGKELVSMGLDAGIFHLIMKRYRRRVSDARIAAPVCDNDVFVYVATVARRTGEGLCAPDGRPLPPHPHKPRAPRRPPIAPLPDNWRLLLSRQ
jgi:hypothetical protein